jgi:uncharacterized membrane protein
MRGPIDFVVVGFEGKQFDGTILETLMDAVKNKTIDIIALAVIRKDADGKLTLIDAHQSGNEFVVEVTKSMKDPSGHISEDDIQEVGELIENDTAAALLIIEQLWAKPFKQALMDAHGVLVAEGRIHPSAAKELSR